MYMTNIPKKLKIERVTISILYMPGYKFSSKTQTRGQRGGASGNTLPMLA